MVAKVTSGRTIRGVINYNENKVKEGAAVCIHARGFAGVAEQLTFCDKLQTFLYHIKRNTKVTTNAVHISLNFSPSEKLDDASLTNIATSYLDKIGFSSQPFLLYRHDDAGHPHVHIATTNVQLNGRKISLNNIGRDKSEPACKEVETEFNLIRAAGRKVATEPLHAADLSKALYGKSETKRTISNIVNSITRSYRFTSIHELNAVLKQYNVVADTGREGTIIKEKNGLRYSFLNKDGKAIGVPIKASSIYGKPTMSTLANQFELNEILRTPHKDRIRTVIDLFDAKRGKNLQDFATYLADNKIYPVLRQNDEGRIYGITFIDNSTKCVFNGSSLGKQYSAQGILNRFSDSQDSKAVAMPSLPVKEESDRLMESPSGFKTPEVDMLRQLTDAEQDHSNTPYELKKKKKRRGRSI
jgi:hypothetical protein